MNDLKSPLRSSASRSPGLSPNRSPNKSPNISPRWSPARSPSSSNYGSLPHSRHRSASIPVTPEVLKGVRHQFLNAPGSLYPLGESAQSSNLLSVEPQDQRGRLPRSAPELTIEEVGSRPINPWSDDPNEYTTALATTVHRPAAEVLSRRFSETLTVTDYSSRHRRKKSLKPHHSRSLSFRALKKTGGKSVGNTWADYSNGSCNERRPRGNSVPCAEFVPMARSRRAHSMQRDRDRSLSPRPGQPHYDLEDDDNYYTLRNFIITSKGSVVNKGDLYRQKSKSNTSVASTGSSVTGASTATSCSSGHTAAPPPKKVLMLGAVGVGKTALVTQFMSSEYMSSYDCSLEENLEKNVSVLLDGDEHDIMFVDPPTAADLTADEATEMDAYVVVYSITDRGTFEKAVDSLFKLRERGYTVNKAVILVGNKSDLVRSRLITIDEGKSVACAYECKFTETSAAINHQVDELLVGIVTQIRLKTQQQEEHLAFKESPASPLSRGVQKRMSLSMSSKKARVILNRLMGKSKLKSQSCGNLHVL